MRMAGGEHRHRPDQPIDVAAVVKASQALSGEMLLPRLIERLMTIALQNAGAERGLLILIRDGEPRIEAEAATGQGKIEVAAGHAAITLSDLPQSALHYVIRTQERVLLDDASADHVYSKDEYVRQRRSKSILCLPIVKQRKLVGALYLENNLTPFVFTPDRVAVLEIAGVASRHFTGECAPLFRSATPGWDCCSDFRYPLGRSSLMGHRTS